MSEPEQNTGPVLYPVQLRANHYDRRGQVCAQVYLAAYEVYAHLYGEQKALLEGDCRGGFGVGELIAFLYARSFPKDQWYTRTRLALHNMKVGA